MKLNVVFNGCSPLQIFNFQSISTRLENIPAVSRSQMEIMCKIDAIRDPLLQRNGSKLFASAEAAGVEKEGETIKGSLDKIDRLITYYETIKEGTIVFEFMKLSRKVQSYLNWHCGRPRWSKPIIITTEMHDQGIQLGKC